jgi:DNA-3-methyladenine glycosylase II
MQQFAYLQSDKKIFAVLQQMPEIQLQKRKNIFLWLVRSVAGQQLSTKAAHAIFEKFLILIEHNCTPEKIVLLDIEQLRAVGFSYNKSAYIKNIAAFWIDNNITDKTFITKSDEDIITYLTQIKGVGTWTVQMLLMFTLGRPNVFAVDDLGIQQAMCKLYDWDATNKKELKSKMLAKANTYAPYSTVICMYLWRWKEVKTNTI